MPLDARILLASERPNTGAAFGRGLSNGMEARKGMFEMQEKQKAAGIADTERARADKFRGLMSGSYSTGADGQMMFNRERMGELAQVDPEKAAALQSQLDQQDALKTKQKYEKDLRDIGLGAQLLGSANSQESYNSALGDMAKLNIPGHDKLPRQWDPKFTQSLVARSMPAKEQIELKLKEFESMGKGQERDLGMQKTRAEIAKLNAERTNLAGGPGGTGKEFKKEQYDAGGFAKRMEQAEGVFGSLEKSGYKRGTQWEDLSAEWSPNSWKNDNLKSQEQAERNFVNSSLRRESGAAISPEEFKSAEQQYFPRAGDTPAVLEQKRMNREQQTVAFKTAAGGAYAQIPTVESKQKTAGAEPVPMMAPDGKVRMVPANQVQAAISAGGKRVEGAAAR